MSLYLGRGALPGVVGGDVLQKFGRRFVPVKQCWSFLDDESNGLSVQTVVNLEQDGVQFITIYRQKCHICLDQAFLVPQAWKKPPGP